MHSFKTFLSLIFLPLSMLLAQSDSTFTQDLARYKPMLRPVAAQSVYVGAELLVPLEAYTPQGTAPKLSFTWPLGGRIDPQKRCFQWTPEERHIGMHPIVFSATDSLTGQQVNQAALITVKRIEYAPVIHLQSQRMLPKGFVEIAEGDALALVLTAEDENPQDRLTLSYFVNGDPGHRIPGAVFDVSARSATFFWKPDSRAAGEQPCRITFRVTDESGLTDEVELPVLVRDVHHAPVFETAMHEYYVDEDELLRFTVKAVDRDGDPLQYRLHTTDIKRNDCLFDPLTGRFQWTPTYAYVRQKTDFTLVFSVSDGMETVFDTVRVKVDPKNYPPEISAIPDRSVRENEPLAIALKISDKNGDENLSLDVDAPDLEGYRFNAETGIFAWTPPFHFIDGAEKRTVQVTFTVSDGAFRHSRSARITVFNRRDPKQALVQYTQVLKAGARMDRRLSEMDGHLAYTLKRKRFWNNFFDVSTIVIGAFSGVASSSLASEKMQEAAVPIAGAVTTLLGVRAILDQSSDKLYDLRQRVLLLKGSVETVLNAAIRSYGTAPDLVVTDTRQFQTDHDQLRKRLEEIEGQLNGLEATYLSLPVKEKK